MSQTMLNPTGASDNTIKKIKKETDEKTQILKKLVMSNAKILKMGAQGKTGKKQDRKN